MSEYVKTCSFCKKEIQMSDKEGRCLSYNKDGSTHDCKKKNEARNYFRSSTEKTGIPWHNCKRREVDESMKWTCFICGQVVPKYSIIKGYK